MGILAYQASLTGAPVIVDLPDLALDEDVSLDNGADLWTYASDIEAPDDELIYTIDNAPAADAGVTIDVNRYIDIYPETNWCGQTDVTIRVTDPGGLWDTDTFGVTVNCVNDSPVVDAGLDRTVALSDDILLDGAVEDDGLPDPPGVVTTAWSQVSGPGMVTFGDVGSLDTMALFSEAGEYVLCLTADDGELAASDQVTVTAHQVSEPTVIEVRVSASDDDVEEFPGGYVHRTSPDLELIHDDRAQTVGLRFAGVEMPQRATVVHASVQFRAAEMSSEATSLVIEGQAADDALSFTSDSKDVTSCSRTGASVGWTPAPWTVTGEVGPDQRTPDLAAVVQEIVDRPGWASGNALALIVSGSGRRVAESYDGSPSGAPLLRIEYTVGGPPVNRPPAVDAGPDLTVAWLDAAVLDGTVTDDGLPDPPGTVTSTWGQVRGPGTVTFADPSAVDTSATFSDTGVYVLRLSANDGELAASDEITITVDLSVDGLLVYPYLGETTPTSVVVSWATQDAGDSEVRYSLDQSYSNTVTATSSVYDGKHWHSATITGLVTDTVHYYRVYTGDDDMTPWSKISFTTAPEPTVPSFTFGVLGDSQSNPTAVDIAAEVDRHSFDLALRPGDLVRDGGICTGRYSSWNQYVRDYFDVYQESAGDTPFYPSIGNHDLAGGDCGYQAYTDVFSLPGNAPPGEQEKYYSFDWGNAHFVALDIKQSYGPSSDQYAWLVSDLQGNSQPWTFVFFHFPPYSSGVHGSSRGPQEYLAPVFETYGVDVVFSGHDHDYERTCPIYQGTCTTLQEGGIVYYVTGGGGADLRDVGSSWFTAYSDSLYHFLQVEVQDCRVSVDAIGIDGAVFDSYTIDRCAG